MDLPLVVLLGSGVGMGVFVGGLLWWYAPDRVARREMAATPLVAVRDVAPGQLVRIVGEARGKRRLVAPFSGRECFHWRVVVQEYFRSGKTGHWETIIDEQAGVTFRVRDATGVARISKVNRQVVIEQEIEQDMSTSSGWLNDASPHIEIFLLERRRSSKGDFLNKRMRFREAVLEIHERVAVVGVGHWEIDPRGKGGGGYRDVPKRLVMRAPPGRALMVSDHHDTQLADATRARKDK
jgi:hypothetical protein